ncbi:UNVERIFIED_CONTAM: hypothetical protein FKN15_006622 [Acipenser sinensis]
MACVRNTDQRGSAAVIQGTCKKVAARPISADMELERGDTLASEANSDLGSALAESLDSSPSSISWGKSPHPRRSLSIAHPPLSSVMAIPALPELPWRRQGLVLGQTEMGSGYEGLTLEPACRQYPARGSGIIGGTGGLGPKGPLVARLQGTEPQPPWP